MPNRLSYLVTNTQIRPYHISKVIYWAIQLWVLRGRRRYIIKRRFIPLPRSMNLVYNIYVEVLVGVWVKVMSYGKLSGRIEGWVKLLGRLRYTWAGKLCVCRRAIKWHNVDCLSTQPTFTHWRAKMFFFQPLSPRTGTCALAFFQGNTCNVRNGQVGLMMMMILALCLL